jgi:signal transduction histidine kinase
MQISRFIEQKFKVTVIFLAVALLVSSFIPPVVIENEKQNWLQIRDELKKNIESDIRAEIKKYSHSLFESLQNAEQDNQKFNPAEGTVINVYDRQFNILKWTSNTFSADMEDVVKKYSEDEYFFYETPTILYLSAYKITAKGYLLAAIPLIKKYNLNNKYYVSLNFTERISDQYSTNIQIRTTDTKIIDGRISNFDLLNNKRNFIAKVIYDTPSQDVRINEIAQKFYLLQSVLLFFIVCLYGIKLKKFYYSGKNSFMSAVFFSIALIFFRAILLVFRFPANFISTELTDPAYFSSTFAFGAFRSPIELFISLIFILSILIIIIRQYFISKPVDSVFSEKQNYAGIKYFLLFVIIVFSYLLFWRASGSAIKSIVFDSSIRYFQDASFIPSFVTLFMEFNLFIIGLITIVFCLFLTHILVGITKLFYREINTKTIYLLLFFAFQTIGFLFDYIQKQPQGNHFLRIVLILFTFVFIYKVEFARNVNTLILITVLIASSYLSIAILIHHNSKLELKSLKQITAELTRSNENMLSFTIAKFLSESAENDELIYRLKKNDNNFDQLAFTLWSNSRFEQLPISSNINIISNKKEIIGSFSFEYSENYVWDWNNRNEDFESQKIISINLTKSSKVLRGITPIRFQNIILGYVEISAIIDLNSLGFENTPPIFSSSNLFANTPINLNQLKIFDFQNDSLKNYYTDIIIPAYAVKSILNYRFNNSNEAWLELQLNGKRNAFYLYKYNIKDIRRIIAVGLEEKSYVWYLFDFFKIFFIHSLFILFIVAFIYVFSFRKSNRLRYSFRFQLAAAFIIISLVPIIILAFYFRSITNEKNLNSIYYKLAKRADNIEEYLARKSDAVNINELFSEAANTLGINFSVYSDKSLVFSSKKEFYNAGLISKYINPKAFYYLGEDEQKEFVTEESIENFNYHSLYHKIKLNNKTYILKISDLFNYVQLPMTGTEIDVFLFGVYSFVIIMLLFLSTVFANQISSPIRKLISATKAVGSGDLSVVVDFQKQGEIKELVDGFNKMVKQLKISQNDLAAMEREAAWKEMAKQVAHEIKNPLTPMKLSMQQLIAARNDNSPKFDEFFYKISDTIIKQIDNLKNIASEFSSFAKMPSTKIQQTELTELLTQTVSIFNEEGVNIFLEFSAGEIILSTDEEQLQRAVINMIRNSIQAKAKKIVIKAEQSDDSVVLQICDDGTGIPDELKEKVFESNFTTKKDGMGIGLYLTKRFVESINGKIQIKKSDEFSTIIILTIPK